ncbi:Alpha/beta hydrolase family protein [Thalictrum thalictroides]|uniref:Alpha/beta hydrolase family protein n=1 Tax=Thalictrum thalictroides TaxID=46969 RepID=A0A7J6V4N2_THATH|nr:Alpha/beta hydrolase family protein [Thalictrum thalictroides]
MISLRELNKTSFSNFPYQSSNVVKQRLNEVSLCKNLTSIKLNSKLAKSNSLKCSVLLSNAFELLLSLPFKRFKKRKDSIFKVSGALKSDFGVIRDLDVGTRRAIAIQRVLEDKYDGNSVRDYFLFPTSRGDQLFIQSWTPVSVDTKGLVVLLHGLNEHSGRYNNFAKQLNANGYKVYGMDWIGHGGSDGLHGYVHSLDAAVSDMKAFLEKVLNENPGLPCFCFGHSTGAAIILKVVMDPTVETFVKGVVLTSPAVRVKPSHPIFWVIAPIFAFLLPKYQFSSAVKKGVAVSRDPDALIAKYSDPLVYIGSVRIRTGSEILRHSSYLQKNLSRLRIPFLVLHGTADTVTDPLASQKLYEEATSTDKSIKLYDGYLHDLLFEPEWRTIAQDIIQWLNCR